MVTSVIPRPDPLCGSTTLARPFSHACLALQSESSRDLLLGETVPASKNSFRKIMPLASCNLIPQNKIT